MTLNIINYPPAIVPTTAGASPVLVQVNRAAPLMTSKMRVGWTVTQRGLGSAISTGGGLGVAGSASHTTVDGDAVALANATALLSQLGIASMHLTDFGAGCIWPDPTVALDPTQPFLDSVNAPMWYATDYRVDKLRKTNCALLMVLHRLVPPWATVKTPTGTPGTPDSWMVAGNNPCIAAAQTAGCYGPPYVGPFNNTGPWTDTIDLSAFVAQLPTGKPAGYTGAMDGNSIAAYIATQAAKRYPDILYWVVANESLNNKKGYSCYFGTAALNPTNAGWTGSGVQNFANDTTPAMDRYTATYNAVYAALKAANPALQVGGPYYTMGAIGSNNDKNILARFFDNCTGLDFIAVDGTDAKGYSAGSPPANSTDQLDGTVNAFTKYTDIITNVRDAGGAVTPTHPKAYGKPIYAMEYYLDTNTGRTDYANTANFPSTTITTNFVTHDYLGVGLTSMVLQMILAGVSAAIRWQAESVYEQFPRDGRFGQCGNQQGYLSQASTGQGGLNTALYAAAWNNFGGQPFPAYWGALWLQRYFGNGTILYTTSVSDPAAPATPRVEVICSARRTLILNKWATAQSIGVSYNGGGTYTYYTVPAYGMALVA